jgi:hypothetical protein
VVIEIAEVEKIRQLLTSMSLTSWRGLNLELSNVTPRRSGLSYQTGSASPVLVSEGLRRLPGTTATTT